MICFNDNDYIINRDELMSKIDPNENSILNNAYSLIVNFDDKSLTKRIHQMERYCKLRREHIGPDNYDSQICRDLVYMEQLLEQVKKIIMNCSLTIENNVKVKTKKRNNKIKAN